MHFPRPDSLVRWKLFIYLDDQNRTAVCVHWPALSRQRESCYPYVQGQGRFPWWLFPFCKKCLLKLSPSQWVRTPAHWSAKVYLDGWAPCGTEKECKGKTTRRPCHFQQHCMSLHSSPPVGCSYSTDKRTYCVYSTHSSSKVTAEKLPFLSIAICQPAISHYLCDCGTHSKTHEGTGELSHEEGSKGWFVTLLTSKILLSLGLGETMNHYSRKQTCWDSICKP